MVDEAGRGVVGWGPYAVAQALTEARTASQVTRTVFDHALRDLGATTIGLWLLGPDAVIRFSAGAGTGVDNRRQRWATSGSTPISPPPSPCATVRC